MTNSLSRIVCGSFWVQLMAARTHQGTSEHGQALPGELCNGLQPVSLNLCSPDRGVCTELGTGQGLLDI